MGLVFIVVNLSFGQSESEGEPHLKELANGVPVKRTLEKPVLKLKLFGGPCTGEIQ